MNRDTRKLFHGLACVLLPCGAFAADSLGCLEFQAHPVAGDNRVDGTVVNTCAKTVTAYNFEVKVVFSDGTSEVVRGLGREFLPSVGILPPGTPNGALAPGERRSMELATFSPSQVHKHVDRTEATPRWIIFDDATAVGDDQEIAAVFRNRREALREWTLLKQAFAKREDGISSQGPLASLIDLSGVRTPQRSQVLPQSSRWGESLTDVMQHMLEWLDQSIENGSISRAEAVRWLDQHLSTVTTNYEKQSERIH